MAAAAPRPDAFLAVLGPATPAGRAVASAPARQLARALHAALKDEAIDRPEAAPVSRAADATLADAAAWAAALDAARAGARVLIGAPDPGLGWPAAGAPRDGFVLLLTADEAASAEALALRERLLRAGLDHAVLRIGPQHPPEGLLRAALQAWRARQAARQRLLAGDTNESDGPRWRHACGRCGDGDCERALFSALQPERPGGRKRERPGG